MIGILPNGGTHRPELEPPGTRWITLVVVVAIHVLVLGGLMWGCASVEKPKEKPTERHYKVNLSSGPSSPLPPAPPEPKVKPQPAPPTPAPPVPPEPKVKPQPPKPTPPEPKVKPKPKPKPPKVKPKPKQPKVKTKPKPTPPQPKVKSKPTPPQPKVRQKPPTQLPKDTGVYTPTEGQKFDPKKKYSYNNTNRNSASSSKNSNDPSARPGPPADSRADEKWQESVAGELYNHWTPPENVFWGSNPPQAVVELTIAADGRVLRHRLVTPSGNPRMDATIREMLNNLTRVPRPPDGSRNIRVTLIPE